MRLYVITAQSVEKEGGEGGSALTPYTSEGDVQPAGDVEAGRNGTTFYHERERRAPDGCGSVGGARGTTLSFSNAVQLGATTVQLGPVFGAMLVRRLILNTALRPFISLTHVLSCFSPR